MTKNEFLRELENSLSGHLPHEDIVEIICDYRDIFENGITNERSEQEISKEIGSPALITRTILEDNNKKGRPYENFQNVKPTNLFLAPMSKRILAYLIDTFSIAFPIVVLYYTLFWIYLSQSRSFPSYIFGSFSAGISRLFIYSLSIMILLGLANFITAFELWILRGYTLGKWILKTRVERINGNKLTFLDAFLRDALIKNIGNAATLGILNIASFVWGISTPEHKTIHDLAVKTRVINVVR